MSDVENCHRPRGLCRRINIPTYIIHNYVWMSPFVPVLTKLNGIIAILDALLAAGKGRQTMSSEENWALSQICNEQRLWTEGKAASGRSFSTTQEIVRSLFSHTSHDRAVDLQLVIGRVFRACCVRYPEFSHYLRPPFGPHNSLWSTYWALAEDCRRAGAQIAKIMGVVGPEAAEFEMKQQINMLVRKEED